MPNIWKTANVTPIYKKGSRSDCGNYRPISLTSILCKVLEALIRDHMVDYIKRNHLITACQHGFVGGRSCTTQLNINSFIVQYLMKFSGLFKNKT